MPASPLRLGVIGCGTIAQVIFKESEGLEIIRPVVAYDPHPANLAKFSSENGCESAPSMESLLARSDIDAVVLTAPPSIRSQQAILAVQFGKAVFSEKPLALSVEEAGVVINAAKRARKPFMVGHVLRYFGGFGVLAERVRSGEFGQPVAITAQRFGAPFPAVAREQWRLSKRASGGLMFEMHVHELDFSRYLLGDPKTVFARSRRVGTDAETDYEDLYLGEIEFENGGLGQYHFSQISPESRTALTIYTDRGVAWAGFGEAKVHLWDQEVLDLMPADPSTLEAPYRKELRLFAESVLADQPVPISGEDGLWAVAMAEAFEVSAQNGHPVNVRELINR